MLIFTQEGGKTINILNRHKMSGTKNDKISTNNWDLIPQNLLPQADKSTLPHSQLSDFHLCCSEKHTCVVHS